MRHETLAPLPMPLLSLKVVTPERIVYEADIDSISVMTEQGEITVLPNHVPLTTVLMPGEMRLKINGAETYLAVSTGFLQVRPGNEIVVLADTAERAEELELEKIEQARERASALLFEKRRVDDVDYVSAAAALEREFVRAKVARRRHAHGKNPT